VITVTPLTVDVETPRGRPVSLVYRDQTSDLGTIGSTFRLWGNLVDEYGLGGIYSSGHLIDIGAHIGSVCVAFLVDNRSARATAIEPLPENVGLLRQNAERNGVLDRLAIVHGAIGPNRIRYGNDVHRFIGNITGAEGESFLAPKVKLTDYLPADIVKLDCEGCEFTAIRSLRGVRLVLGEYHNKGPEAIQKALGTSHDLVIDDTPTGAFRAVMR